MMPSNHGGGCWFAPSNANALVPILDLSARRAGVPKFEPRLKGNFTDHGAIILHNPPVKVGALTLLALGPGQVEPSISARMAATGEFEILWKTVSGRNFQIETSVDLIRWTRSPGAIEATAAGQYRARFNGDMASSFFRLIAE